MVSREVELVRASHKTDLWEKVLKELHNKLGSGDVKLICPRCSQDKAYKFVGFGLRMGMDGVYVRKILLSFGVEDKEITVPER